jgi:hypothetical protein
MIKKYDNFLNEANEGWEIYNVPMFIDFEKVKFKILGKRAIFLDTADRQHDCIITNVFPVGTSFQYPLVHMAKDKSIYSAKNCIIKLNQNIKIKEVERIYTPEDPLGEEIWDDVYENENIEESPFKEGDRVIVTKKKSRYYNRTGIITYLDLRPGEYILSALAEVTLDYGGEVFNTELQNLNKLESDRIFTEQDPLGEDDWDDYIYENTLNYEIIEIPDLSKFNGKRLYKSVFEDLKNILANLRKSLVGRKILFEDDQITCDKIEVFAVNIELLCGVSVSGVGPDKILKRVLIKLITEKDGYRVIHILDGGDQLKVFESKQVFSKEDPFGEEDWSNESKNHKMLNDNLLDKLYNRAVNKLKSMRETMTEDHLIELINVYLFNNYCIDAAHMKYFYRYVKHYVHNKIHHHKNKRKEKNNPKENV